MRPKFKLNVIVQLMFGFLFNYYSLDNNVQIWQYHQYTLIYRTYFISLLSFL